MISEEERYIAWTKEVISAFLSCACLGLTPIGLVLNILQAVVFARKKFDNSNTSFYFMVSSKTGHLLKKYTNLSSHFFL